MKASWRLWTGRGAAAACLAVLAACSGDANPVRDIAASAGLGPKTAEAPDFVRQSRPATLDYMPIGRTAAERPTAARNKDEVKATEAELDAIRKRNEAAAKAAQQAGATPPPKPVPVPAGLRQ